MVDLNYEKISEKDKLPEGGQETAIETGRAACICGTCPTYTGCAREIRELLYCFLGRSPACITTKQGCLCPGCPITREYGLKRAYFCVKGSEREQRPG